MLTFPTSEGMISANCFGAPKTFRAPQNTTCYVRLNIRFGKIVGGLGMALSVINMMNNGINVEPVGGINLS